MSEARVVIAGAGIAGASTAFHLSVTLGVPDVVVCDPRPPLTLTSDKSTECYRNWWPGPGDYMVAFMNRSIDLLEQWAVDSNNVFNLSRRGYLYVTADSERLVQMATQAEEISALGAGELRVHRATSGSDYAPVSDGWRDAASGADMFLDGDRLRQEFPYLTPEAVGGLHARRAGWFSAQQLGMWLLERAREHGARVINHEVVDVDIVGGEVAGIRLDSGDALPANRFVNAAGPLLKHVGGLLGEELPVHSELHRKISFADSRGAIPRDAPMLIWSDPQLVDWDEEVRAELANDADLAPLAGMLGPGAHCRPDGPGDATTVLGLWEYVTDVREPVFPIPENPLYPEMVLNGLSTMLPSVRAYLDRLPASHVDGGYYTKTVENRPLIGPTDVAGSYVVGALSGYGVMAAAAAGELAALHVMGRPLPSYSAAFHPNRYDDPEYREQLATMTDTGQL